MILLNIACCSENILIDKYIGYSIKLSLLKESPCVSVFLGFNSLEEPNKRSRKTFFKFYPGGGLDVSCCCEN